MSYYVDVHTHLTHDRFTEDLAEVIQRADELNVKAVVVNGLEPISNRSILEMAETYEIVIPALGIYPIDAVNHLLPEDFPARTGRFDVKTEIQFIREQAEAGNLAAVGECGLDGHWLGPDTFKAQEEVLEELADIGMSHDIPIIVHSRKMEKRTIDLLDHLGVERVDFHCFCGRSKYAIAAAESHDNWTFSIPANARKQGSFQKLMTHLPEHSLLTETDAPYLAPVRGERNEPANVVGTVEFLAELKSWPLERARELIWNNYLRLFNLNSKKRSIDRVSY